jgi:type IV secretion system protein TrbD
MQPTLDHLPGFEIPIHRSLTDRLLLAGVPREFAMLNATFAAAFVFGLQCWYALPIGVGIHWLAIRLTRRDDQFFDVLRRNVRFRIFYRA